MTTVCQEMAGVLQTLSKLNTKTLSPLQLRDWSAQKTVSRLSLYDDFYRFVSNCVIVLLVWFV